MTLDTALRLVDTGGGIVALVLIVWFFLSYLTKRDDDYRDRLNARDQQFFKTQAELREVIEDNTMACQRVSETLSEWSPVSSGETS